MLSTTFEKQTARSAQWLLPKPKWLGRLLAGKRAKNEEFGLLMHPKLFRHEYISVHHLSFNTLSRMAC